MTGIPVVWGVVGCGWVARDYVAPALAASSRARPVVLCDRDPAALAAMADRLPGTATTADLDEFLATPGLEAVYVATPNVAHRPVVEAAAAAGKAVLCEKPLAATVSEAERLVEAAAAVPAGVAFDQRWHPAHLAMRELIGTGALGTVTAVRITYGCWLPPGWSPDGRPHDNWRADPVRAGGGALVDLAPHGLDLAGMLLGDDVTTLQAVLQHRVHDYAVDDGAVLVGATGGGVLFSAQVAYNLPDALPRRRLEVVGTRGQVTALDTMGQTPGGTVEFCSAHSGRSSIVDFDRLASPFTRQIDAFSLAVRQADGARPGPSWPYPVTRDLALHRLLLDAAAAGSRPASAPVEKEPA